CAEPGYGFTAICWLVARVRRERRNPETSSSPVPGLRCKKSPGWRCAEPGYGFTAICWLVARVRRERRNPGIFSRTLSAASGVNPPIWSATRRMKFHSK
ncbi:MULTISPECIES: hypothetical protein, partial [Raoultella]